MTREQVKQELRELKSIVIARKAGIEITDQKGLEQKYQTAISQLEIKDQIILRAMIYKGNTQLKISFAVGMSYEGLRKRYKRIIDRLANMFEIKKTNFDRITSSVDALAEFVNNCDSCPFQYADDVPCHKDGCKECIKEWLQSEAEAKLKEAEGNETP